MVAVILSDSIWIAPPFPTVISLFSNVALLTFKVPLFIQIPANLAALSDIVELITFTIPPSAYKNAKLLPWVTWLLEIVVLIISRLPELNINP